MRARLLTGITLLATLAACQVGRDAITSPDASSAPLASAGGTNSYAGPRSFAAQDGSTALRNGTASMWAVQGETRSMALVYGDGTPFVTFTVPAGALVRDAAGQMLADGDSVRITMALPSPSAFAVQMEPSGLQFSNTVPATLRFNLNHAGNAALHSSSLSMWKQETADAPWMPVAATFDLQARTATASVPGFTIYAIIY